MTDEETLAEIERQEKDGVCLFWRDEDVASMVWYAGHDIGSRV